MDHETTPRGFRTYRIAGGCRGQDLQVTESSIAFEGAHIRIYHGDDEHVQLHVDAAEKVAEALLDFVRAARADELTEPVYVEDGGHGHEPPAG
jgi:hypothetical protein